MSSHQFASSLFVSFMLLAGCEKAADEQQKAINAQNEANKKIAEASNEAAQKMNNAQDRATSAQNVANDQIAKATNEAQDKVNSAQADANKKISEAQANFMKMREDFRHKAQEDLIEVDKKIAELEAKALKEKAKAKAELDARAKEVRTLRTSFSEHLKGLESSTAETWDEMKKRLDKELEELKDKANK